MGTHATPSPLCSRGYPTWGCTISFWVPPGSLKKKRANFAIFKFSFFAITRPKMVKNAQNQNYPTRLSKIYLHSKFQLIWSSNGRENPKYTLFWGSWSLLKAKWAEIWCEHRFLIGGLGELDFGHFWPFLAELWQKNCINFGPFWTPLLPDPFPSPKDYLIYGYTPSKNKYFMFL